jgi:hypothetical protein
MHSPVRLRTVPAPFPDRLRFSPCGPHLIMGNGRAASSRVGEFVAGGLKTRYAIGPGNRSGEHD